MNIVRSRLGRVRVAIPLPPRCWASAVYLGHELLLAAGTLKARAGDVAGSALFEVRYVGASMDPVESFGGAALQPQTTTQDSAQYDVVLAPAQFMPEPCATAQEELFADWIRAQHAAGALVVCLGGSTLLAKTGLLDGKQATGLLADRHLMSRHFPRVRFEPSRRIVARGNIVTTCGFSPAVDACAHIMEHFFGAELARRFLRLASAEVMPAQEELGLWSARYKAHRDSQILAAQDIVERELHEMPPMARIAARVGISARVMTRRWQDATGMNLRQYIARLRLELGETLLRTTDLPLARVASECGYSSASALSRAFIEFFGRAPRQYRIDCRSGPPRTDADNARAMARTQPAVPARSK
ncbi:HTH-type transcriptional regulator CdhR [mine drainage metagenome]|jgi:transcriptional regulator GlxA family with amidase domain|uniref:HTH-type transcriptional regulator CdhR n=1 Tax=mine drainage metagenome TaxID=410659 RepID=A0A1J5QUX8_9ZZZZ